MSATTGLGKPPSWTEPISAVLGAAEKAAKPGVLDGLAGVDKWRGFGMSTSLARANRDHWDLDSVRREFDALRGLSDLGKPGALGDFGRGWTGAASFYGAGGLAGAESLARGSGILDGVFETLDGIGEIARKTFGLAELLKPYWDGWARTASSAVRAAERIVAEPVLPRDDLLAFAAYDALEALLAGKHWVAVAFLKRHLNLRSTPERLEALWMLLKRGFERPVGSPPPWLALDGKRARAYLATAVFKVAERIRRRRRMEDDIWGTCNGKELVRPGSDWLIYISDQAASDFADSGLDPAELAERGTYDRDLILDELAATGTPADREVVGLIRTGRYDRADIRNLVGSTRLQAFERKVQRRTENRKN